MGHFRLSLVCLGLLVIWGISGSQAIWSQPLQPAADETDPFGPALPQEDPDPFGPPLPEVEPEEPAVPEKLVPKLTAEEMAALVRQAGDDSYQMRHDASAKLREAGLDARESLSAGLDHDDPEISRRCRWILADVMEDDFRRRLRAFMVETDGMQMELRVDLGQLRSVLRRVQASFDGIEGVPQKELPCWSRYKQEIGEDAKARELFAKMQEAEPCLLESSATSTGAASESLTLRFRQVYGLMATPYYPQRRSPSLGTVAAMLFVASQGDVKMTLSANEEQYFASLVQQSEFSQAASDGPYKPSVHKLMTSWLLQPSNASVARQKLQIAMRYGIESGVVLAVRVLKDKENISGTQRSFAIASLGRLGGKKHLATLAGFLDDESVCYTRSVNGKPANTEIRDIALAWLVHTTEQDLTSYGLGRAKTEFDRMKRYSYTYFNTYNMGFDDISKRDEMIKKWRDYAKKNPLPKPPPINDPFADKPTPDGTATDGTVVGPAEQLIGKATANKDLTEEEQLDKEVRKLGLELADRSQIRELSMARDLCKLSRFDEAVRRLDRILAAKSDFAFKPDVKVPLFRCLKPEAESLLAQMPPAGRAAYRSWYDADARRMLHAAVQSGDVIELEAIAGRFFLTPAGAEATYLLAVQHLAHGHPLHAALRLQRLHTRSDCADHLEPALSLTLATSWWKAGMVEAAREALLRLRDQHTEPTVDIGGEQHELFTDPKKALAWLESIVGPSGAQAGRDGWTMFGGDPARNANSRPGTPYLKAEPLASVSEDPVLNKLADELRKEHLAMHRVALPKMHPLVVDQTVLLRTATSLQAIDVSTGTMRWEAPLEDALRHFLDSTLETKKQAEAAGLKRGLQRRYWEDQTYGTLSSDGRCVFGIEDISFGFDGGYQRMVITPDGQRRLDMEPLKEYNLLTAYDIETGKLKWEVGGPPGLTQVRLGGRFFLGPPLPLGGRLYIVAETGKQTRSVELLELDAETGNLISEMLLGGLELDMEVQQQMGFIPTWILDDPGHHCGASPSYADGVLVCRDGKDRFLGVDLSGRTVLWSYQMQSAEPPMSGRMVNAWQRQMMEEAMGDPSDRWTESSMTVSAGRVLITPDKAEELICLDLADGRFLWSAPRRDGLYVGGVYQGLVIVVGRGSLWALNLADGKPAWPSQRVPLPPGSVPSGRGYLADGQYYLPLSTAEVAVIDVAQGHLIARSQSPDGIVPGNLVQYGDSIFSQDFRGVWRFDRLSNRREQLIATLEDQPNDPETLTDLAEILLYQGELTEAVKLLKRAEQSEPNNRSRDVLLETVIAGLQVDFETFRPLAEALDPRIEVPDDRRRFLQQMAQSQQTAGDASGAFATYLKLLKAASETDPLQHFASTRLVRPDRWVRSRVMELRESAPPDRPRRGEWAEIDQQIATRLSDDSLAMIYLDHFDTHPAADQARLRLATQHAGKQRADKEDERLKVEQLLRRVLQSDDESQRGRRSRAEAVARMAQLLRAADRPGDAALYYAHAADQFADTVCLEGKTGRELIDALEADDPVRKRLDQSRVWPTGKVEVTKTKESTSSTSRYPIRLVGEGGPLDAETTFLYDSRYREVLGHDPAGRVRWKVRPSSSQPSWDMNWIMSGRSSGRLHGQLLILHTGGSVCAINGLKGTGEVLWTQSTSANRSSMAIQPQMMFGRMGFGGMPQVNPLMASQSLPLAVGHDFACFQQGHKLLAVDTLTGKVLWERHDQRAGCDLFGDDELLFVTSPGATEAAVFDVGDGREVGRRKIPAISDRMWTLGRRVVTWKKGQNTQLTLVDPWKNETVWQRDFHTEAHPWLIDGRRVAVFDPEGNLAVVDLESGKNLMEAKVDAAKSLEGIVMFARGERFVLIVNQVREGGSVTITNSQPSFIPVNGRIYGFDRSSLKKVWSTEVTDQAMRLGQPAGVPVLTLGGRMQIRENNRYRTVSKLLCLDTRNGKVLHKEETSSSSISTYEIQADPEKATVEVLTTGQKITLTFTDQPEDEPTEEDEPTSDDPQAEEATEEETPQGATIGAIEP